MPLSSPPPEEGYSVWVPAYSVIFYNIGTVVFTIVVQLHSVYVVKLPSVAMETPSPTCSPWDLMHEFMSSHQTRLLKGIPTSHLPIHCTHTIWSWNYRCSLDRCFPPIVCDPKKVGHKGLWKWITGQTSLMGVLVLCILVFLFSSSTSHIPIFLLPLCGNNKG